MTDRGQVVWVVVYQGRLDTLFECTTTVIGVFSDQTLADEIARLATNAHGEATARSYAMDEGIAAMEKGLEHWHVAMDTDGSKVHAFQKPLGAPLRGPEQYDYFGVEHAGSRFVCGVYASDKSSAVEMVDKMR